MKQIALTIEDAVKASGLSRTRIYQLIGDRLLVARKAGRRTLVMGESLETYLANLPAAAIAPPKTGA
jgi:hypothetical protein